MKTVKITANPANGNVFTPNENLGKDGKQYGYIRVESTKIDFSQAVARVKTRSALKTMLAEDFAKVAGMLPAGSTLEGQIIRKDSLQPHYEGQEPLQVPVRDEKNNVIEGKFRTVTSGGVPVYRVEVFTDNQAEVDELLSYDKVEATISAKAATKLA